ncbi:coiled-coil domain-containing protein 83 isoform X2 [Esox lucius]|uniref:coiled-coil domain-containing protein 83 isoform X2 n=1 Tax=Esox lucius TaxID=8010 RepID=UPI001476D350|nr:coiled-coil domain-containing protein 83 isoform X2 [Esox lucius]
MCLNLHVIMQRLQVKRKEIQEFQEEIRQLDAKKQRYTQLREQLKEEQMGHIRLLRKQAKELEQKLEQREVVNKEQVDQALQQNLELIHRQEKELAELRAEVSRLGEEVLVLQGERHIWQEYKMVGSQWHQQQIQHLEAELAHVQRGFQEMADNIQHSLKMTVNEIDKTTAHLIDEKKHLVTARAIKNLDQHSRHEIRENEWLKRELAIYKREVSILAVEVQQLEEENLEHLSQLFKDRLDDLQISRDIFLTQAAGLGPSGCAVRDDVSGPSPDVLGSNPTPPLHPVTEAWWAQRQAKELERDETSSSCSRTAHRLTEEPPQDLSELLYGGQTHLQRLWREAGGEEESLGECISVPRPLGSGCNRDSKRIRGMEICTWAFWSKSCCVWWASPFPCTQRHLKPLALKAPLLPRRWSRLRRTGLSQPNSSTRPSSSHFCKI